MEAIVVIVGFLGVGKTTLLKKLVLEYQNHNFQPFVILNDYENAKLDAAQFQQVIDGSWLKPLNGSCICCSGINELREAVNSTSQRKNAVTLIEANGTSDACKLMGFLGVGLKSRFLPPIQICVVDAKNWQLRGKDNELEANQAQVASIIVLNHLDKVDAVRKQAVIDAITTINPSAELLDFAQMSLEHLVEAKPSNNDFTELAHHKAHWASASVDLPRISSINAIRELCDAIPASILRVKGCTQIDGDAHYTFFERVPDGEIYLRVFQGEPITGAKLLTIGPGSDPKMLNAIIEQLIPT
ncbi:GTP-binding protein [Paraferrimonas sp. SM1919]|uniref:GTP-binding protein n=1 Tax=Paraferrimonas sp. SM1919 TaxID=2662263 RepID=UPI0013D18AF9|nr:GTP-binding protein [Paraferrimonas sp. SM1919]